jgi:hypothetical protein
MGHQRYPCKGGNNLIAYHSMGGARPRLVAAVTAWLCLPLSAHAIDQAYVAAVRAEIGEITTGKLDLPPGSPWIQGGPKKANPDRESSEYKAFARLLRRRMPGTYIQYRRLAEAKQMALFHSYIEDGDLEKVRHRILATLHR